MSAASSPALIVRWSDLDAWDIKAASAAVLRARRRSFRPFGEFVEERTELVRPKMQPEKHWPVYGVSNQTGAFLSGSPKGLEFSSPYKRIEKDWFFHNPTRANVGSFARVPDVEDDAITSPEYQVWAITAPEWSPDFVEILLQLPLFMEQVHVHRVGTVKQRLYVENLRRIPVPVLNRKEQDQLVREWRRSADHEESMRRQAAAKERHAAAQFIAELGLTSIGDLDCRKTFSVRWSEMGRWAVAANRARAGGRLEDGRFPLTPLGDLIADLENGWSPKCLTRPAEGDEWGVLKVGAVSSGIYEPRENKALPPSLAPQSRFEVVAGDFLIGRANITHLVGACASVIETPPRLMLSDKIFRVRWREDDPVDPTFLDAVLKLPFLRAEIESAATGSSPTMKNISKPALLTLPIPYPPRREQERLATVIWEHRSEATALLLAADEEQRDRINMTERKVLRLTGEYGGGEE